MNIGRAFINFQSLPEFDNHCLVSFNFDKKTNLMGFIAIHRFMGKSPSFGATRLWNYSSPIEALKDALRLSKTMSYKAALAGLPVGGAKAVLISTGNLSIKNKELLLSEYAKRVNYLSGKFITGSDVGISKDDVKMLRKYSPYIVGTRVNPEKYTALGLLYSIKAGLKFLYGKDSLKDKSIAILGIGKVGRELLKLLYKHTKKITISDLNGKLVKNLVKEFKGIKAVKPDLIYREKVDIFSPCALSGCINSTNVKILDCKLIVGGANNQLESENLAEKLFKKGILYAPDYVVNAGGLISVYDEYRYKTPKAKRIENKIFEIANNLSKIFKESQRLKKSTLEVANQMAEKVINKET